MDIVDRFLKYVSFDTQSDPYSSTTPSSYKQLELGKYLVEEMKSIGILNAYMDDYGNVYGTIDANNGNNDKGIGFISHMDTSPDASGKDIKPRFVNDYQGNVITLNKDKGMYLDPKDFDFLKELVHHDLIITDGNTLLGADDKAGISIIMSMAEYYYKHPEVKHNTIQIAFTTDEEIGNGTAHFNLDRFNAKYAYTIDGGDINEIAYENFNAFTIKVEVTGKSIHPGSAKNKMINSILVAQEFQNMLPVHVRPESTEGYEGFNHLHYINGNCERTDMEYIIRNHDLDKAKKQCNDFYDIRDYLNKKYGYDMINVNVKRQYLNMKEIIDNHMDIVNNAIKAMELCGLKPVSHPIRGGTDGANLTYKGLPCPNLGTGGYNYHGPYELVSTTMMKKQVEVLLKINELSKEDK